jgi:probable phosphoglycerate mutase
LIYIIRHGRTEWNERGMIQGQKDSPLTNYGIKHSTLIGRYLNKLIDGFPVDIYSSTSGRSSHTADIILPEINNVRIITKTRDLVERSYGIYEGKKKDKVDIDDKHPSVEKYSNVNRRIKHFLSTLREYEGDSIIIVHQSSGRILIANLIGQDYKNRNNGIRIKHNQIVCYDDYADKLDIIELPTDEIKEFL